MTFLIRYNLFLVLAGLCFAAQAHAGKPKPSCNLTPPEKVTFEGTMNIGPGGFTCNDVNHFSTLYRNCCGEEEVVSTAHLTCNSMLKSKLEAEGYSNLTGPIECIKKSANYPGAEYVPHGYLRIGSVRLVTMDYKVELPMRADVRRKKACELIEQCLINLDPGKYDKKDFDNFVDQLRVKANALRCD